MMIVQPRFVLDIFDTSGSRLGVGPVLTVKSVSVTEELDKTGSFNFTVPTADSRVQSLLALNRLVQVRTDDGLVAARGYITKKTLAVSGAGEMLYSVEGQGHLWELAWLTTGYNRVYDDADVKTEIVGTDTTSTSLLGGTGWTQGTVEDYGNTTISFDAQTRFNALLQLARQLGRHVRQSVWGTKQIDFGVFGSDSGVRLINVHQADHSLSSALFSTIQVSSISADIENRLYPLGQNKFDLRDAPDSCTEIKVATVSGPTGASTTLASAATAGSTTITVSSATNITEDDELWIGDETDWTQDHEIVVVRSISGTTLTVWDQLENSYAAGTTVIRKPQFYVEDTGSQSTYGVREACPQFGWIGPGDSSAEEALQIQAAQTLYLAAQARLTRYSSEYKSYTIGDVVGLGNDDVKPGEKVHLTYRGVVNAFGGTVYEEIDGDFYVLKIARKWTGDGKFVVKLDVANTDRPTPSNAALILFNLDTGRWIGLR